MHKFFPDIFNILGVMRYRSFELTQKRPMSNSLIFSGSNSSVQRAHCGAKDDGK
mgnify:CR=1 FL=1